MKWNINFSVQCNSFRKKKKVITADCVTDESCCPVKQLLNISIFFFNISFMFSAIKTRYRRQVDLPLLCHTNHETSFVYFNFLLSLHLRLESCSLMAAAYSLGQSENCVKRLRQFVFNLVFHVSRFLSRFDTTPIRRKRAWLVLCWEVCPRTKSSSYLTQHPTSFATLWSFDSDFSTSLQEFFLGFCGFPFSPGACFSKIPKLFGPISGATIPFISSQRRGSKPSNFAILLAFLTLKTC